MCGLLQMRAEQAVMEKQQQQAHEAALRQAYHDVAVAREAERTATGKAIASEQVGCHPSCSVLHCLSDLAGDIGESWCLVLCFLLL